MQKQVVASALILLFVLSFPVGTYAEEDAGAKNMDLSITNIEFGDTPNRATALTVDDLKERVVVMFAFGVRDKKCKSKILRLNQIHRKYRGKSFVLIGWHNDLGSNKLLKYFSEKHQVQYPILNKTNVKGFDGTFPETMVFDHTGVLIYRGKLEELGDTIDDAVEVAPPVLTGDLEQYSALKKLAKRIAEYKSLGRSMKDVRKKMGSKKEQEASEAKLLFDRVDNYVMRKFKVAERLLESNVILAARAYQEVADEFKGDEFGNTAAEKVKEIKGDSAYAKEANAWKVVEHIVEMLKRPGAYEDQSLAKKVRPVLIDVVDKHRGTAAAHESQRILDIIGEDTRK